MALLTGSATSPRPRRWRRHPADGRV